MFKRLSFTQLLAAVLALSFRPRVCRVRAVRCHHGPRHDRGHRGREHDDYKGGEGDLCQVRRVYSRSPGWRKTGCSPSNRSTTPCCTSPGGAAGRSSSGPRPTNRPRAGSSSNCCHQSRRAPEPSAPAGAPPATSPPNAQPTSDAHPAQAGVPEPDLPGSRRLQLVFTQLEASKGSDLP